MRLSPLFLSVLLFVTATGLASAGHPGGASGDQTGASHQADRQLARQARRSQRGDQLNSLRERYGHGARHSDGTPSAGNNRVQALMMILPADDPSAIDGTDPADANIGDEPVDDTDGTVTDPPEFLGPPIVIDDGSFWEGFPVDEEGDLGDSEGKPGRDHEYPIFYTLGGEPGPQFRGNHGGGPHATHDVPFAPLEQLRGNAQSDAPVSHIPDALPNAQATSGSSGNFDLARADRILAKRLADIDHLRDVALKNGNLNLLDQADKLESIARTQYERRTGTTSTPEPQPEPPATDPVTPTPDPVQPPVDETPTPGVEEPLSESTP